MTPGSVPKTGGELDRSTWQGQVAYGLGGPLFRPLLALRGCAPINIRATLVSWTRPVGRWTMSLAVIHFFRDPQNLTPGGFQ